ncbi:DUF4386 domain-containing protein [Aquirufa antheringensis]|jgi:hypothetical protein|uniref:DUF4386 domain-containing protein n=1 Tax=Aquirufa antheringensis TaxID=2516559 RepID=UPI0022A89A1E|nr:DUF4386 domain-containing protein [Aquirufa antheringensis]MCZ2487070.1 DUF4386 domain-containing protein [Aquirufa antheringensis]MCZ2489949.1 DUF4386 domain-containing protein [Aquirufa antheringensis]
MTTSRKTSLTAGILYLLTFISIPTLSLYHEIHQPNFGISSAPSTDVVLGGMLELVMALACIGTALAFYPVLKKQNEMLALGFVAARILEATLIFAGVASLLTVLNLRSLGTEAQVVSRGLVMLYDRLFLISQSFIPAVNGLLLGSLLYQTRLVPRILPIIGIIGAFTLVAGDVAVLYGFFDQRAPMAGLSAVPIALWEFSLGIYLTVKGFKENAVILG